MHNISIESPPPNTKGFDRGERIIIVDGVRWGRTIVTHHGMHGTKHLFEQEGGGAIPERADSKYPGQENIRRSGRRFRRDKEVPLEEALRAKVAELIAAGKLRHPDVVRAENEAALEAYRARRKEADDAERERFEQRAREVIVGGGSVDLIVAAMRWAQEQ